MKPMVALYHNHRLIKCFYHFKLIRIRSTWGTFLKAFIPRPHPLEILIHNMGLKLYKASRESGDLQFEEAEASDYADSKNNEGQM